MLNIIKGDVLDRYTKEYIVIVHCCNDIGGFGSGIAGAIRKKYPQVAADYEAWFSYQSDLTFPRFKLGQIQLCNAEKGVVICNLIGQRDIGGFTIDGEFIPPVRYEAIYEGMLRLRSRLRKNKDYKDIDLRSPLLGCGLALGKIEKIYEIVDNVFGKEPITYTFYAFTDEDYEELKKASIEVTARRCELENILSLVGEK